MKKGNGLFDYRKVLTSETYTDVRKYKVSYGKKHEIEAVDVLIEDLNTKKSLTFSMEFSNGINPKSFDKIVARKMSHTKKEYALKLLESKPTMNFVYNIVISLAKVYNEVEGF